MRSDAELMRMYHDGKQHELSDDERNRLHELEEYRAEVESSDRCDAIPHDVVFKSDAEIAAAQEVEDTRRTWPDTVLHPQGLVGEVNDWILLSSPQQQPKFALAAALTVCGALLGRVVKDYTGQRTNIFTLCLAPSSGGKQHPFSCCQKLILALGYNACLAGEVTSDSALECLLYAHPSRLLMLDEVGDYVGNVKNAGHSNSYMKTVLPRLKALWSSGNGIYTGKTRAADTNGKWHEPKTLKEPHIVIYGTGAPSRLYDGLTDNDFDDGTLPRFISFISEKLPLREEKPDAVVPDELKEKLGKALKDLGLNLPPSPLNDVQTWDYFPATTREVKQSEGATKVFREFEVFKHSMLKGAEDDKAKYLWGKVVENARRIALIVASLRNPENPIVEECDAEYAIALMKYSVSEAIEYARSSVGATQRQKDIMRLERIVRRAGKDGIDQSNLTRKTQGMKYRNELLDELVESKTIHRCERNGQGRKKVHVYYHSDFVE